MTVPGGNDSGEQQTEATETTEQNSAGNSEATSTESRGSQQSSGDVSSNDWQQPISELRSEFDGFRNEFREGFSWLRTKFPEEQTAENPAESGEEQESTSEESIQVVDREPPKQTGRRRATVNLGTILRKLSS